MAVGVRSSRGLEEAPGLCSVLSTSCVPGCVHAYSPEGQDRGPQALACGQCPASHGLCAGLLSWSPAPHSFLLWLCM